MDKVAAIIIIILIATASVVGIFILIEPGSDLMSVAGTSYSGEENIPVQLNGDAAGGLPPYQYHWELSGDNSFDDSSLQNPQYTWTTQGNYIIYLKVIDSKGDEATSSANVVIVEHQEPPPPEDPGLGFRVPTSVGSEFWVTVYLDPPQEVGAWKVSVSYDETIIQAQSVICGNSIWSSWLWIPSEIGNGEINNVQSMAPGVNPTYKTDLFRIKFKVISQGTSPLEISDYAISDSDIQYYDVQINDSSVTV